MADLQILQAAKVEYDVACPRKGTHFEKAAAMLRWALRNRKTGTLMLSFKEGGLTHPSKWSEKPKLPSNGKTA